MTVCMKNTLHNRDVACCPRPHQRKAVYHVKRWLKTIASAISTYISMIPQPSFQRDEPSSCQEATFHGINMDINEASAHMLAHVMHRQSIRHVRNAMTLYAFFIRKVNSANEPSVQSASAQMRCLVLHLFSYMVLSARRTTLFTFSSLSGL